MIASRVGSSPANPLCLSCTNEKSKARHIKPHVKSSSVYLHRSIDRSIIIPGAPVQRSEAGQLHALSSSLHSDLSNILSGSRAGRYTTPSKQRATNQVNSLKEHAWPPRVYSHCDHYLWQRGRCKKKKKLRASLAATPSRSRKQEFGRCGKTKSSSKEEPARGYVWPSVVLFPISRGKRAGVLGRGHRRRILSTPPRVVNGIHAETERKRDAVWPVIRAERRF